MTDLTFPVKKILLAAAAAPISYAVTIVKKSVPGIVALVIGYLCIGLFTLNAADIAAGEQPSWLLFAMAWLIGMVAFIFGYTVIAVTLHRIFLLGTSAIPGSGIRNWSSRETRFFGWGIAVGLVLVVPAGILISLSMLGISQDVLEMAAEGSATIGLSMRVFIAMLPIAYLLGRLLFVLPATATGSKPSLGWSWAFSRKYHLQTALVIGVAPVAASTIVELVFGLLPALLAIPLMIVFNVYLGVFGIAVLSFSYGFLKDAQPDLLPPAINEVTRPPEG